MEEFKPRPVRKPPENFNGKVIFITDNAIKLNNDGTMELKYVSSTDTSLGHKRIEAGQVIFIGSLGNSDKQCYAEVLEITKDTMKVRIMD